MKPVTIILLCLAFSWGARCAETAFSPEAVLLARWIAGQQYHQAGSPGYGGLKIGDGVAATGADGAPYYRVNPYSANLGVLGMLRTRAPGSVRVAGLWIDWYFAHLNAPSAPDGVPCDHFYLADGKGETTCLKPGDHSLCHFNDATDSAAATFFSVLWAAHRAGISDAALNRLGRERQTERLAGVLLKLQQPDGLCWAKSDYRVKYLEDNCEVFAGLSALASLEQDVFSNQNLSLFYETAARHVQAGILEQLYDPPTKLFFVAEFEDNHRPSPDLNTWYPDTQAQSWPCLFGVIPPADSRIRAALAAVNTHWNGSLRPDWATDPEQINRGWMEAGHAYTALLMGETNRVRIYFHAVKHLKFQKAAGPPAFTWPFSVADAGWLLQILEPPPDQ